jgi:hypothetical protein
VAAEPKNEIAQSKASRCSRRQREKGKPSAEKARTAEENQAREFRSDLKLRQENTEAEGKLGTAIRYKKDAKQIFHYN